MDEGSFNQGHSLLQLPHGKVGQPEGKQIISHNSYGLLSSPTTLTGSFARIYNFRSPG
jgi:hypothetical protein